jgi:hypothetical protein
MTLDDCGEDLRDYCKKCGVNPVLELKLETPDARYWLCTQGASKASGGVMECHVVGYVTPEYLDDGMWDFGQPYGPETVNWLQGMDYYRALGDDHRQFLEEHERTGSWEAAEQAAATFAEMEAVRLALLKPSVGGAYNGV